MTYIPPDQGKTFRDDAGRRLIRYTALPPLPAEYRKVLIDLGLQCMRAREGRLPEYVRLMEEFDRYERQMRNQFGVEVIRREYVSKEWVAQ